MRRVERQLRREEKLLATAREEARNWLQQDGIQPRDGYATLRSAQLLVHRGVHGGPLWILDERGALLGLASKADALIGKPSWRLTDTGGQLSSIGGGRSEGDQVMEIRRIKGWGLPRSNATFVLRPSGAGEITIPCGDEPADVDSLPADDDLQRCRIIVCGTVVGFLAMPPWAMGPWQVEERSGRAVARTWHVEFRGRRVGTVTVLEDGIAEALRAVALATAIIADDRHIVRGE